MKLSSIREISTEGFMIKAQSYPRIKILCKIVRKLRPEAFSREASLWSVNTLLIKMPNSIIKIRAKSRVSETLRLQTTTMKITVLFKTKTANPSRT